MKNILVLITLCFFSFTACDCTTTRFYPSGGPGSVDNGVKEDLGQGKRIRNQQLMAHIKERTVLITVDCTPKSDVVILGTSRPDKYGDGWGTGIIVRSGEGRSYLYTAAHVVEFSDSKEEAYFNCNIDIQRPDEVNDSSKKIRASIVVKNKVRDVAVLSVDVDLGVNTDLELNPFTGEDVWAAGFPVQKASSRSKILSITKGTLATVSVPAGGNTNKNGYFHRVTAQVYFGNSGGGIWTKEGKLVSIVSSLYAGPGGVPFEGYYYTKPVSEVLLMLDRSKKYQEVYGDVK